MRSIHLVGVTLMLPEPELDFFRAYADRANYFVVEVAGAPFEAGATAGEPW